MKKGIVALSVGILLIATTVGAMAQTNDAWIPGLASLVLPGAGQFINGEMDKALWHLGVAVGLGVATYYVSDILLPFSYYRAPLIGLVHLAWGVYSALDAYEVAEAQGFRIGFVENGIGFQMTF